jgi:NADH-quinone oxidoreductase subunit E
MNAACDINPFNLKLMQHKGERGALIPMLQMAQDHFGYIPESAINQISSVTGVPVADIYGIITFYAQFRLHPMGQYVIRVCEGTSCHVNNAKMIMQTIQDELSVETGETDAKGHFTLLSVACIGCCSLAPVIMVNSDTHGRLAPSKVRKVLRGYRREAKKKSGEKADAKAEDVKEGEEKE